MSTLEEKRILVGVSGGIAIYKTLSLLSLLNKRGAQTHVIMTAGAQAFIQPLAFQTMSKHRVHTELFCEEDGMIPHIDLTRAADVLLIAPASADLLAKLAHGLADDLLSATALAADCPVLVAPAMNVRMYHHPATQENLRILRERGVHVIAPEAGWLACNEAGDGRMPEAETLAEILEDFFTEKDLRGKRVVVTGGATKERLDPVRYLTNDSSGKQGAAIAKAAVQRGAQVCFIHGDLRVPVPRGVSSVQVESTEDLLNAVQAAFPACDAVIMAAAPSDYRPLDRSRTKLKKNGQGGRTLALEETPDILATLGAKKQHQILIGFAAETDQVLAHAREKLEKKHLDYIVANDVTQPGAGFDVDTNIVTILSKKGETAYPQQSKDEIAHRILDLLR